ncbi:Iron-sulfur cluster assembly 1-like [Gracilariopsis chorda]|uniref:Iron-sulfur cluster assembly 1-like n=1 Tax=Gracilariopsis chorda TaxID=448386 RepID=A0A2V3J2W9_9FLOR|nr:Iron-sulfur cluster assembly 1-like [Gracilariopsis chorda]|eukprot:PXF48724.1 Iron-sulfur cluster assembly 1-like [Gracilariopsis chorda]
MLRFTSIARQFANRVLTRHPNLSTSAEAVSAAPARRTQRRAPAALEVTPAAAERIRYLLSQKNPRPAGVRIGLRTRGCNGMAYTLNYAQEGSKFDEKVSIEGADVYIDPRALMHIVGTKMDFLDNDLVSEFVFHNPNAKGTCGCGESFNV